MLLANTASLKYWVVIIIVLAIYAILTYIPLLNNVNERCNFIGEGEGCNSATSEVGQILIRDIIILAGSFVIGNFVMKSMLKK